MKYLKKIFNVIYTSIVFLVLIIYFFHPIPLDIGNSDLGRHLLLGKIIVNSGQIPNTNVLSYTFPTFPFINTHWLSEVIFYFVHNLSGFNGLSLFSVILIVLAFSLIFVSAAKKFGIFLTATISLLYIQILAERIQIRPELFSFLFLSIFLIVLYRYKKKYTRWIFILIPLELLWVNFHIYFFVGIVVLLLFLLDAFITKQHSPSSKKFLTLLSVTLASSFVTLLNPNFIKGALYPLFVLNNYGLTVQENTNFLRALSLYQDPTFLYFGITVVILWIGLTASRKKLEPIDFLIATTFTLLSLFAVRNFPLFIFGTLIICIKAASFALSNVFHKINKKKIFFINIISFSIICVLLIPAAKFNMTTNGLGFGITDNANDAVNFLLEHNLKGKIYNNFDAGNYLAYRLYPKEQVFVDGRPEAYPKDFFQKTYFPTVQRLDAFEKVDKKYHFNIIFFAHTDISQETNQLLYQLARSNEWRMVYLNNTVVIFLKNIPANQEVINTYSITEKNVKVNNTDFNDKNRVMQLANFFWIVGWENQQTAMTLRYLDFDPNNCPALKNVVSLLQKQNNSNSLIYANRYKSSCI